jgi:DNA modification methylase
MTDEIRDGKHSEFRPQARNANSHTDRGMEMLATSIDEVGWIGAITVAADGEVFDGSARHEVAGRALPKDAVVIDHDGKKAIYIRRTDIPNAKDPRAVKAGILANRTAEVNLEWNVEALEAIGEEVDLTPWFTDEEMDGWGDAVDGDWDAPSEEQDEEATADLIEEAEQGAIECRFKLGDIIALGRHRIACGDSTDEGNVRKLLGDAIAALVHADPPYGMGKEKDGVLNDNLYQHKLDAFQMQWWKACRPHVADNGSAYIWGNAEDLWRLWYAGGLKNSERLTIRNEIVWDKYDQSTCKPTVIAMMRSYANYTERCLFFMLGEQGFNNNADNYWEGFEPIRAFLMAEKNKSGLSNAEILAATNTAHTHYWTKSQWAFPTEEHYKSIQVLANGKAFKQEYDDLKREYDDLKREWYETRAYFNNTHENMTDVWHYPRVQGEERWGHATPKPVDMISRIYKSSSPDTGVIYSPFLGSGTDVIAAQKMDGDRTVYGMELSPEYIEIICRRFESFTGITAELAGHL